MAVAIGDVIRIAARQRWNGVSDILNVFHYTVTDATGTGGDTGFMEDVADALADAYALIAARIDGSVGANDVQGYNVTQDYPMPTVAWGTLYVGGAGSGDGLPPGVAALVLWRTAVKRTVGKVYLPPFGEAQQAEGVLIPAAIVDIQDWADTMRGLYTGANGYQISLVVYRRSAGVPALITAGQPQTVLAYQRRRRPGSGS